jgi:hypothetical protein
MLRFGLIESTVPEVSVAVICLLPRGASDWFLLESLEVVFVVDGLDAHRCLVATLNRVCVERRQGRLSYRLLLRRSCLLLLAITWEGTSESFFPCVHDILPSSTNSWLLIIPVSFCLFQLT